MGSRQPDVLELQHTSCAGLMEPSLTSWSREVGVLQELLDGRRREEEGAFID